MRCFGCKKKRRGFGWRKDVLPLITETGDKFEDALKLGFCPNCYHIVKKSDLVEVVDRCKSAAKEK